MLELGNEDREFLEIFNSEERKSIKKYRETSLILRFLRIKKKTIRY